MTWNAAKKNDDFIKHVPLMRAYPTFNLVLYYIGAIICGLCGFLMTIIAILLKDTWQDAWPRALEQLRAKPDQLSPQGWEVIEKLDEIGPYIPTIFAIIFLIIAAVMILAIIRETKLVRIIKSLSASAVTGKIPHLKIGFFSGLTYTIVGFLLVQTATSVTGPVIGTLTSLCTIGALALPVIMLNLIKEDIHKCEALQKSEDTI